MVLVPIISWNYKFIPFSYPLVIIGKVEKLKKGGSNTCEGFFFLLINLLINYENILSTGLYP